LTDTKMRRETVAPFIELSVEIDQCLRDCRKSETFLLDRI
jgi:hypothetical protein